MVYLKINVDNNIDIYYIGDDTSVGKTNITVYRPENGIEITNCGEGLHHVKTQINNILRYDYTNATTLDMNIKSPIKKKSTDCCLWTNGGIPIRVVINQELVLELDSQRLMVMENTANHSIQIVTNGKETIYPESKVYYLFNNNKVSIKLRPKKNHHSVTD